MAIFIHGFNDILAILHHDDLVLCLLEQVTIIFFSFGLMSFCLGSLMPGFWFTLSPPLARLCSYEKNAKSDSAFQGPP